MFDDEIEHAARCSTRSTGHLRQKIPALHGLPVSHYVTPRATVLKAIEGIKEELRDRIEFRRRASWSRPSASSSAPASTWRCWRDRLLQGHRELLAAPVGAQPGEPPPTLSTTCPGRRADVHRRIPRHDRAGGACTKGDRSRKENLVEYGFRLPSALDNRPLKFEEFERLLPQTVFVSATPADYEQEHQGQVVSRWCGPPAWWIPASKCGRQSHPGRRSAAARSAAPRPARARAGHDAHQADGRGPDRYLAENGIRVRYLHSDIDTVERVEIIRDLRLGEFDVLVGINLLREGASTSPRSRWSRSSTPTRRVPALRAFADPDHRPRCPPPPRHGDPTPTGSPIR